MPRSKNYDEFWPITRQPKELVVKAERFVRENYMSKSELTRQALTFYLKYAEAFKDVEEENFTKLLQSLKK